MKIVRIFCMIFLFCALADSTLWALSPFQQDFGPQGLVSVEAESYHGKVPGPDGHEWVAALNAGYSGTGAMAPLPEDKINISTGYSTNSPRLDYQIAFVKTGKHYIWIRGLGPSTSSDSLHVGLDGMEVSTAANIAKFSPTGQWAWSNKEQYSGAIVTLNVSTPGEHTLNVWMRESGMVFDKVVLTTDPLYVPSGLGPPESPRSGSSINHVPVLDPIGNRTVGEGQLLSFTVRASDLEGTIPILSASSLPAAATFVDNGDGTGAFSWMTEAGDAAGSPYTITFTATDASDPTLTATETISIIVGTVWPTNGWIEGLPSAMGMDQLKLEEARDYALTGGGSGYITRGGVLVMKWGDPAILYGLKSTTKSIGVTLLGNAIKDGLLNLSDLAQWYLPDIGVPPESNVSTGWLDQISLMNLATHTAGFGKSGGYVNLIFEPGSVWAYSDGGANWLADLLTVLYGEDLNVIMYNRVFSYLGIKPSDYYWRDNAYRDPLIQGIIRREFGSGISMNVDAMARIGYLYLQGGTWDGQEIIPQSFVNILRNPLPAVENLAVGNDTKSRFAGAPHHYGLLWWNNADGSIPNVPRDAFWAWGLEDSLIVVIPSLNIVASRAGSEWSGDRTPSYYNVLKPFIGAIAQSVLGSRSPVAMEDTFTINKNTVNYAMNVLANDSDPDVGDVISLVTAGPGDNGGAITVNGDFIDYTPTPEFVGMETFPTQSRMQRGIRQRQLWW